MIYLVESQPAPPSESCVLPSSHIADGGQRTQTPSQLQELATGVLGLVLLVHLKEHLDLGIAVTEINAKKV